MIRRILAQYATDTLFPSYVGLSRPARVARWAFSRTADLMPCFGTPCPIGVERASVRRHRWEDRADNAVIRVMTLFPDRWYDQND